MILSRIFQLSLSLLHIYVKLIHKSGHDPTATCLWSTNCSQDLPPKTDTLYVLSQWLLDKPTMAVTDSSNFAWGPVNSYLIWVVLNTDLHFFCVKYQIRQPIFWAFCYVVSRRFLTLKDRIQTKAAAVSRVTMKQVKMSELGFCPSSLPH